MMKNKGHNVFLPDVEGVVIAVADFEGNIWNSNSNFRFFFGGEKSLFKLLGSEKQVQRFKSYFNTGSEKQSFSVDVVNNNIPGKNIQLSFCVTGEELMVIGKAEENKPDTNYYTLEIDVKSSSFKINVELANRLGYKIDEIKSIVCQGDFNKLIYHEDIDLVKQIFLDLSTSKTPKTSSYNFGLICRQGEVIRYNFLYTVRDCRIHCVIRELESFSSTKSIYSSETSNFFFEEYLSSYGADFQYNLSDVIKDFFQYSNDYICVFDTQFIIHFINNEFLKGLKYDKSKLVSKNLLDFVVENKSQFISKVEDTSLGIFSEEIKIAFKNKDSVLVLMVTVISLDNQYFGILCRNISELDDSKKRERNLTDELQRLNLQLRKKNNMLSMHLKERDKILKKLKMLTFTMDQFNYQISHNIRSPLASILGILNIKKLENEYSDMDDRIYHSAIQLDATIRSINDYYYNFKSPEFLEKINFDYLIKKVITLCKSQYPVNISFNYEVKIIRNNLCDSKRLETILNVLLNNAFKFHDPDKENPMVYLSIISNESLEIEVKDNGIGIPSSSLDKVGRIFYKAHYNYDGAGIGLYNVKSIVDSVNGTISIRSEAGRGTTVKVLIPVYDTDRSQKEYDTKEI